MMDRQSNYMGKKIIISLFEKEGTWLVIIWGKEREKRRKGIGRND